MALLFRALALLAILGATLFPAGSKRSSLRLCFLCGDEFAADFITNILLFAPLGAALALGPRPLSARRVVPMAALLSLAIELAQLVVIPGRDPSIRDLLANTLGGWAGWVAARYAHRWLLPEPAIAAALSLAAALVAAAAWWGTGWLLQPSLPRTPYYGQWTPVLDDLEHYEGRVLEARLGPRPLRPERLAWSAEARALLLGGARLRVHAVAGPAPGGVASLVSIYDERDREVFLVGPHRNDLVLRYRTRADALGFDRPDLRLQEAFTGVAPGRRFVLSVERSAPGNCLALNLRRSCGVAFTLGRGWALLLYPESFPPWLKAVLDGAWMAGLLLPVGLWWRERPAGFASVALALAALVGVPPLMGLSVVSPPELAAASVGLAVGITVRGWAGRRLAGLA